MNSILFVDIRLNDNNENILHIYCKDKRCKRAGSLEGTEDNSISEIISIFYEFAPHAFTQKTKLEKQTPLHFAMKSGNIQKARIILNILSKSKGNSGGNQNFNEGWMTGSSSAANLFNFLDFNGMRAIDLLAIRQDTEHKK